MGETIRAEHRGRAVGTVQSGYAIGWAIAAMAYMLLFKFVSPAIAWRAMFWIGILPAFLVFYIRRNVPEPDVFSKTRKQLKEKRQSSNFWRSFHADHPGHSADIAGLNRCHGRLLAADDVAADLSENGSQAFRAEYRRIPMHGHCRLVRRLSRGRAPCGLPGPQEVHLFYMRFVAFLRWWRICTFPSVMVSC